MSRVVEANNGNVEEWKCLKCHLIMRNPVMCPNSTDCDFNLCECCVSKLPIN